MIGGYTGANDAPFPGVANVIDSINPDIVLLHIGTNDYSLPVTTSMNNIHGIINAVRINNPNVIFFVANMIPIGKSQFQDANNALAAAIESDIESYSTQSSSVHLVDVRTDYDMTWFTDMVHPDSRGEAFMADRWADAIIANVPEPAMAAIIAAAGTIMLRPRDKCK